MILSILTMFSTIVLYLLYLYYNVEIFSYKISIFLFTLASIFWIVSIYKLKNKDFNNIYFKTFIILFLGILISILIFFTIKWNIIFSIILWTFFSSIMFTIFDKSFFVKSNIIKLKYILSLHLTLIFIINIFILVFYWSLIPNKDKILYSKCFESNCFYIYSMLDPFFFWENFLQVYYFKKGIPYLYFKKNIIYKNNIDNLDIVSKDWEYFLIYDNNEEFIK